VLTWGGALGWQTPAGGGVLVFRRPVAVREQVGAASRWHLVPDWLLVALILGLGLALATPASAVGRAKRATAVLLGGLGLGRTGKPAGPRAGARATWPEE
jgi:hypothetical protein